MARVVTVPWSNTNSERDIIDAMLWNRRLLRILGVWTLVYPNTTRVEKILTVVSLALCWSGLGFLLIPLTVYTFSERTEMNEKIRMLGPLGYVFITVLKYFFLVVRCRSIRRCIGVLSVDWRAVQREDHRQIMIKDAAKSQLLCKFCVLFMYCGGLFYHIVMPFLSQRSNGEQNITIGPMPYPGFDIIFDLRFMPAYVFVFCAQCLSATVMFNVTTAVCCLAAMFVAHACGQVEVVMARVKCFVKSIQNNNVHSEERMGIIVKQHVHALRFSASIDAILREICLIEILAAIFFICLLEYYCITEWNNSDSIAILTYFFLLVSFVFNIFIFCFIGELLTNQCSKIGYASYKIKWYYLPGKVALDLMLLINMAHRPVKLTAGKLIELSFICFGSVLKTSMVYLNLLRTVV